ncbi:MAG: hypothetical protein UY92_C0011G0013 [Candidatus Magasanikbacteria bacterium GW2011_GWA2_56_11]|uniref:Uncharacterized protein n=1 Tax=Candidatus Magasanikbacteria bacterium GW2011_GWA2_56_11 TaxID=1619044 RepID=A0A0G1YFG5_9BACT|nr:MAG: hypothetical protein UY92_C0011G0013 [Candidatus Magasanikbacteria bacterium GW2011_GWA2_56_11]
MNFLNKIKEIIGDQVYSKLESEADKEVALAMQMPLKDQYRQEKYYQPRHLISVLFKECELF